VDTSANPLIYFSIWYAAAEDFQLHGYAGNPIEGVSSYGPPAIDGTLRNPQKIAETQCDMIKLFNQPFEGLAPAKYMPEQGVIRGEQTNSLLSMLHRYHWYTDTIVGDTTYIPVLPELHVFQDTPFYLIAPFLFMRGGMRYMQQPYLGWTDWISPDPNNRYYSWSVNNADQALNNGASYGGSSTAQPFRAEIPYYDYRAFLEIFPTIDTERVDSVLIGQAQQNPILRCMADDFSVGVLSTPPPNFYIVS